jgi:hypothetical protein
MEGLNKKILRALGVLSATLLPLGGLVAFAGPAAAAVETVTCGQNVNHSLTVGNNIGPCPGDGLRVTASGITLNLGGHTITGNNGANHTGQEQVGIHLLGVSGVTVTSGTVQNFDAGVAVEGGSGNTITSLIVRDNIQHDVIMGTEDECNVGDGITASDSDNNRIQSNVVTNNGPYSGVSLVEDSDNNVVSGNQVTNNNVSNISPITGETAPCGAPFSRPYQDIGIRIEGPGADNNAVQGNNVANNMLDGITVHGYVCHPPGGLPSQPNNGGNTISGNNVTQNGFGDPTGQQDGIAILSQGPAGVVCVAFGNSILSNVSTGNARHGIFVGGRGSHDNTINQNVVRNNVRDGIFLTGPSSAACGPNLVSPCPGAVNNTLIGNQGTGNTEHDGHDANPNCDNNHWQGNRFGTVNQACVAAGGGTGTVKP